MVTVQRAMERQHQRSRTHETWLTFDPRDGSAPFAAGLGTLELLNEIRMAPGAAIPRNTRRDVELVTYVHEGCLAYEDSMGHSGVLQAGDFQRVTSGRSLHHSKMNMSRTDWAHFYQLWLRPSETELEPGFVQKRFSTAERQGRPCLVASPQGRTGSLILHADASISSALLDQGQHIVRELSNGRCAWLHVVQGEVTLGDVILASGDGAGIWEERAVSVRARTASEILLLDLTSVPVQLPTISPSETSTEAA
jgi:quercetin 2,3-dioxygenase